MKLHLIDGTYELFRSYYGAPSRKNAAGTEVGAVAGLLRSLLVLIREERVTHAACAFDHVVESFRNELFDGYKTGEGIDPELLAQFPLAEQGVEALGLTVWPMVEFEADDVLATAALRWGSDDQVGQVVLCSPDKDLAQCVVGKEVVMLDRRKKRILDEEAVLEKFGVKPKSIPDWLALVGDPADGIPGVPGWGAKSASQMLAQYGQVEGIPKEPSLWKVRLPRAKSLSENLESAREQVDLYRRLARLRRDVPIAEGLEELTWPVAGSGRLKEFSDFLGFPRLMNEYESIQKKRFG